MLKANYKQTSITGRSRRGMGWSMVASVVTILFASASVHADAGLSGNAPLAIDHHGFDAVIKSDTLGGLRINSAIEIEADSVAATISDFDSAGFRLEQSSDDARNLDVRRFSTSIESAGGRLTVGNDWSNFEDFLGDNNQNYSGFDDSGLTSEQLKWSVENGFSVSLEKDIELVGDDPLSEAEKSSQSLVLSWQNNDQSAAGRYSVSALGRRLELENVDQAKADDLLGWGLKLAGGWQFGDLFVALSMTLGNRIDSLILGNSIDRNPANRVSFVNPGNQSFSINPGLNYRLGDNSNLHFAINRFETGGEDIPHGVDTLDTIHLGYSWNTGSSAKFGIEFVGKNVEGNTDMTDSNAVNFVAGKRF